MLCTLYELFRACGVIFRLACFVLTSLINYSCYGFTLFTVSSVIPYCFEFHSIWLYPRLGFQFDNVSNENSHLSTSSVSMSKRVAVDSEGEANGVPPCPVDARISRVIEESRLPIDPGTWSVEQVSMFIKKVGFAGYSCVFKDNDVDGEALLLLREEHILNTLGIKLGPALKLFKLIKKLQSL